jgi:hypothetical protein
MKIVLVHGILGFREKFGIEYFHGVAEYFRAKGLPAFVPIHSRVAVDLTG